MYSPTEGQQFLAGHLVSSVNNVASNEFIFPTNGPVPTAGRNLLLASAGFEAACGITPDCVLPDNFLLEGDPDRALIFAFLQQIDYTSLPQNGSPTNHAGDTRILTLCGNGVLDAGEECDDGNPISGDCCDELTGCANEPIESCLEEVPTGGSVLWLVTAFTLLGLGVRRLGPHIRTR